MINLHYLGVQIQTIIGDGSQWGLHVTYSVEPVLLGTGGGLKQVEPFFEGEPPWNVLKYHPEEITELYLGLAMTMEDKEDMVSKAKALNPEISIFQMGRDADTKLTFNRI